MAAVVVVAGSGTGEGVIETIGRVGKGTRTSVGGTIAGTGTTGAAAKTRETGTGIGMVEPERQTKDDREVWVMMGLT